jgi:hypothetical protein
MSSPELPVPRRATAPDSDPAEAAAAVLLARPSSSLPNLNAAHNVAASAAGSFPQPDSVNAAASAPVQLDLRGTLSAQASASRLLLASQSSLPRRQTPWDAYVNGLEKEVGVTSLRLTSSASLAAVV